MDRISESHEAAGNRAGVAIEASLNYLEPTSEKPVYYAYEPPVGTPRAAESSSRKPCRFGTREKLSATFPQSARIQITHQETAMRDFYDRDEVERAYYPEVEQLLKEATGAEKVLISTPGANPELAGRGEKKAREYGRVVHNDYTAKSGPRPSAIIYRRPRPMSA